MERQQFNQRVQWDEAALGRRFYSLRGVRCINCCIIQLFAVIWPSPTLAKRLGIRAEPARHPDSPRRALVRDNRAQSNAAAVCNRPGACAAF
jgi:hypothetical protein